MACRVFGISFLVAVLTIDVLLGQGPDQQVRPEPRSPTPEELEAAAQEVQGVRSLLAIVPLSHVEDPSLAVTDGTWVPQGPGPNRFGQVQNLNPNNEVFGAIHAVVAHPSDANTMYIGAVNGGIWRTTNATAASPTWTALTDFEQSLSISALEMDPGNTQVMLAGIGRFSSFGGDPPFLIAGGDLNGLLRTTDGGTPGPRSPTRCSSASTSPPSPHVVTPCWRVPTTSSPAARAGSFEAPMPAPTGRR